MKDKILTSVFGVPQERIDALREHNNEHTIQWLERAILEYLDKNPGVSSVEIASHFKLTPDITLSSLARLVEAGIVTRIQPRWAFQYYINKSTRKEQNTGACYLCRWVVEIDGEDLPTCVWATNEGDAISQAIQMHEPKQDVKEKIKKVYLHKK